MHTIERNCDLRVHLEEGGPLELRSCQVLQVSCVCSNADRSHTCSLNLVVISNVLISDSTNSGDNMYTMINTVPPGGSRPNVRHLICLCVLCVCVCVHVLVCIMAPTVVKNNCSAFLYCAFGHPSFPWALEVMVH